MSRRGSSSQQLWTEAEALERAGKAQEAIGLFVKGAVSEEEAGEPLRARFLWEEIGKRTGATGTLLERLAICSEQARLVDDAYNYWIAAANTYARDNRLPDAHRARLHAEALAPKFTGSEAPPLALQFAARR